MDTGFSELQYAKPVSKELNYLHSEVKAKILSKHRIYKKICRLPVVVYRK